MAEVKKKVSNDKKVIFVVEDDLFLVQAYQIKFEKEKVEVWVATDGKEALSFLDKEPPKVVILDLLLPGLNGLEFLSILRQNKLWKSVPVIVLTNLNKPESIVRAKELGVVDYIVKAETRIDDIVEKIKKYL